MRTKAFHQFYGDKKSHPTNFIERTKVTQFTLLQFHREDLNAPTNFIERTKPSHQIYMEEKSPLINFTGRTKVSHLSNWEDKVSISFIERTKAFTSNQFCRKTKALQSILLGEQNLTSLPFNFKGRTKAQSSILQEGQKLSHQVYREDKSNPINFTCRTKPSYI